MINIREQKGKKRDFLPIAAVFVSLAGDLIGKIIRRRKKGKMSHKKNK